MAEKEGEMKRVIVSKIVLERLLTTGSLHNFQIDAGVPKGYEYCGCDTTLGGDLALDFDDPLMPSTGRTPDILPIVIRDLRQ